MGLLFLRINYFLIIRYRSNILNEKYCTLTNSISRWGRTRKPFSEIRVNCTQRASTAQLIGKKTELYETIVLREFYSSIYHKFSLVKLYRRTSLVKILSWKPTIHNTKTVTCIVGWFRRHVQLHFDVLNQHGTKEQTGWTTTI